MKQVDSYSYYKSMIKWYLYTNGNGWEETLNGFIKKHTENYKDTENYYFITVHHGVIRVPKNALNDVYDGIVGYNTNPPTVFQAPKSHVKDCILEEKEGHYVIDKKKFFEIEKPVEKRVIKYEKFSFEDFDISEE